MVEKVDVKPTKKELLIGTWEAVSQAIFMPITMYTGFGRLVVLHDIKTKYLYVSLGQEVFLHNLPLTLLIAYNDIMLRKAFRLDVTVLVISGVHLLQVVAELTMFRVYLNKGVNLEKRIKFTSNSRAKDLFKLGLASAIFGAIALTIGWFAFKP